MLLDLNQLHMKANELTLHCAQDLSLIEENVMVCISKSVLGDWGLLQLAQIMATTVFTDMGVDTTLHGSCAVAR